jgi:periplasmic divalent cation tolerance protein
MSNGDFVQIMTAVPSPDVGHAIADALVESRLAACVQMTGPVESTYRWHGAIERAEEWLCLIKTTRHRYSQVAARIRELHPYETPEIIATPIVDGDEGYLTWIGDATAEK